MSELKPCPFCGGEAQVNTWTMHGITESRCFCSNSDCPNSVRTVALEQWNTRPIEDALIARAERAEAMLKNVFFVSAKFYSRLNKTSKDGSQLEYRLQQFAKYYAEWIQENEDEHA